MFRATKFLTQYHNQLRKGDKKSSENVWSCILTLFPWLCPGLVNSCQLATLTLMVSCSLGWIPILRAIFASRKLWVLPESIRITTFWFLRIPTVLIVLGVGVPVMAFNETSGNSSIKKSPWSSSRGGPSSIPSIEITLGSYIHDPCAISSHNYSTTLSFSFQTFVQGKSFELVPWLCCHQGC